MKYTFKLHTTHILETSLYNFRRNVNRKKTYSFCTYKSRTLTTRCSQLHQYAQDNQNVVQSK